jgi:hypothetical protein
MFMLHNEHYVDITQYLKLCKKGLGNDSGLLLSTFTNIPVQFDKHRVFSICGQNVKILLSSLIQITI